MMGLISEHQVYPVNVILAMNAPDQSELRKLVIKVGKYEDLDGRFFTNICPSKVSNIVTYFCRNIRSSTTTKRYTRLILKSLLVRWMNPTCTITL